MLVILLKQLLVVVFTHPFLLCINEFATFLGQSGSIILCINPSFSIMMDQNHFQWNLMGKHRVIMLHLIEVNGEIYS